MKKALMCLLVVLFIHEATAQKVTMYKTFGGVRFEYDSTTVSPRQVSEIISIDPVAAAEFKRARTNSGAAGVFGFAGGFLLAFPLGTAVAGGDPEWGLAAGGAALLLASLPFNRAFKLRATTALDHYNKGQRTSRHAEGEWRINGLGVSLRYKFR